MSMKMISREAFAAARNYIMIRARPLDQARFRYHFEGGDSTAVVQALAAFQNEDGGFGHGLEPDLRTPASSAIATATGLAILREVGPAAAERLVAGAVRYLLDTYDDAGQVWPIVPPAVEDAPHAPWWNYAESASSFDGFRINPRASLLGHLYHFAAGQKPVAGVLASAGPSLLNHVASTPDDELGMHDLLTLTELAEADNVPDAIRRPLIDRLRRVVGQVVETDPARWAEYTLRPLQVAPSPDSLLASAVPRPAVDANLDYAIEGQAADGSWDLPWSWDFVDAAAWAQAERDWKGFHAVNYLRAFAAYGRLAA
jgi:hypothetical protein